MLQLMKRFVYIYIYIYIYRLKSYVILLTKAWPIVSFASNNPIVIYLCYQSNPKKIMTRAKIFCVLLSIHKSKLLVTNIQFSNFGKTYINFDFSTNVGNISWKICFLERKTTQAHKCKTKHLNKNFPQIAMAIDFTQLEGQGVAKKKLMFIILFERIFDSKKP